MNINHQHETPSLSKAAFDEEENEVRGTLVFKPPVEILPKTRRTEEMQRRKLAAWVLYKANGNVFFFFGGEGSSWILEGMVFTEVNRKGKKRKKKWLNWTEEISK